MATDLGTFADTAALIVHNRGPVSVYIGGSAVTADETSTGGLEVVEGEKVGLPAKSGAGTADLYAITAAGSSTVTVFYRD